MILIYVITPVGDMGKAASAHFGMIKPQQKNTSPSTAKYGNHPIPAPGLSIG
jgi:hypothetical protein